MRNLKSLLPLLLLAALPAAADHNEHHDHITHIFPTRAAVSFTLPGGVTSASGSADTMQAAAFQATVPSGSFASLTVAGSNLWLAMTQPAAAGNTSQYEHHFMPAKPGSAQVTVYLPPRASETTYYLLALLPAVGASLSMNGATLTATADGAALSVTGETLVIATQAINLNAALPASLSEQTSFQAVMRSVNVLSPAVSTATLSSGFNANALTAGAVANGAFSANRAGGQDTFVVALAGSAATPIIGAVAVLPLQATSEGMAILSPAQLAINVPAASMLHVAPLVPQGMTMTLSLSSPIAAAVGSLSLAGTVASADAAGVAALQLTATPADGARVVVQGAAGPQLLTVTIGEQSQDMLLPGMPMSVSVPAGGSVLLTVATPGTLAFPVQITPQSRQTYGLQAHFGAQLAPVASQWAATVQDAPGLASLVLPAVSGSNEGGGMGYVMLDGRRMHTALMVNVVAHPPVQQQPVPLSIASGEKTAVGSGDGTFVFSLQTPASCIVRASATSASDIAPELTAASELPVGAALLSDYPVFSDAISTGSTTLSIRSPLTESTTFFALRAAAAADAGAGQVILQATVTSSSITTVSQKKAVVLAMQPGPQLPTLVNLQPPSGVGVWQLVPSVPKGNRLLLQATASPAVAAGYDILFDSANPSDTALTFSGDNAPAVVYASVQLSQRKSATATVDVRLSWKEVAPNAGPAAGAPVGILIVIILLAALLLGIILLARDEPKGSGDAVSAEMTAPSAASSYMPPVLSGDDADDSYVRMD